MNKRWMLVVCGALLLTMPLAMSAGDKDREGKDREGRGPVVPGPNFGPGGEREGFGMRLTDEQETELLNAIKDRQPEVYRRLMESKDANPMRYRAALKNMWPWYQRVKGAPKEIQKAMIDEGDARVEVWRLVKALGQAKEAERAKLLGDLHDAVSRQFTAEQILREYRLNELEQQIGHLREELEQNRQQREQIIKDRLEELQRASTQPAMPHHRMGMGGMGGGPGGPGGSLTLPGPTSQPSHRKVAPK